MRADAAVLAKEDWEAAKKRADLPERNPELAALLSQSRQSGRSMNREPLMQEKARNPQGREL